MKLRISLNEERGDHSDRIAAGWRVADVEINNIEDAREVFCKYSYSPHEWIGGYSLKANYKYSNFLVIDFDDGVTIDQARDRFKSYPYIIVTSRNHQRIKPTHEDLGQVDRFHVILPLKSEISDKSSLENLKQANLFAGSDPSVFGADRKFFASPENADIYINENGDPLDITALEYTNCKFSKTLGQKFRF